METTNPLNANREDSLRAVIQVAYFAYKDYYIKLQELPTGRGYADIVYLPKPGKGVPALVVELKWNRDAAGAIRQIKQKDYPAALAGYGGELLLVGALNPLALSREERKNQKLRVVRIPARAREEDA